MTKPMFSASCHRGQAEMWITDIAHVRARPVLYSRCGRNHIFSVLAVAVTKRELEQLNRRSPFTIARKSFALEVWQGEEET